MTKKLCPVCERKLEKGGKTVQLKDREYHKACLGYIPAPDKWHYVDPSTGHAILKHNGESVDMSLLYDAGGELYINPENFDLVRREQ